MLTFFHKKNDPFLRTKCFYRGLTFKSYFCSNSNKRNEQMILYFSAIQCFYSDRETTLMRTDRPIMCLDPFSLRSWHHPCG